MKKITSFLLIAIASHAICAQSFIQAYKDRADAVSQTDIITNLQAFAGLGVKKTGTQANVDAFNWIKNKYLSYGYSASQISEDTFPYGNTTSKNLIITKTGTVYPDKYVIICGHFDSITGTGVNDNGSGTSIILEAARILRTIPTEYSIKFIHFSGEEQGLVGSSHYVNNVVYQGNSRVLDIKLVFNLDQVGGVMGNANNTVYCDEDMAGLPGNNIASATVTQELRNCTALYSTLMTEVDPAEDTDYIPFEERGEVITGFFERIRSTYPHTVNDTFANTDPEYIYKIGKAAVGALQHFAVAATQTLGTQEPLFKNSLESIKIYPNPAKDFISFEFPDSKIKTFSFEITDFEGRSIFKTDNNSKVNISGLKNGAYVGIIKTGDQTVVRKIIIAR
ncbi:aminopeptidase YwaD [Chryseobacterium contaminans]|uniref:Aminopeptidase YwaD n=3 Tax=Chryseobacterium contaminans TaxID=1423959 RepID=A0A1M7CVU6_9FLAO|nr:M28 family peptidase [Chryseobacterium contaminans]SHL71345.1 aminopeptidase YwaD [Chryseobacterium contaminans]